MTTADLRAWQARMGYTQAQAAHALGMSLSGYQQLQAGKSRTTGKPLVIDRRTELACEALASRLVAPH